MKILNIMLGRQAIAAALVLSLSIPMSIGAFAEEPALPPRPHRGPLSWVCSPFLKLNKTQQERSAGMTRWGAPAVFGIYERMSNFTAHSA